MREDWKLKKLGDICFIRRGSSPRPIKNYLIQEGGMPWVKISDATEANGKFINSTAEQIKMEGVSKSVIVNPGDLILSNSGTAGLPMFMGITACIHDGWQTFRDLNGIDKEYLYYFLLFIRNILLHNAYDSVMKNLTLDMLRDYEIYLPPMDEQKRIVDVLHTIDNKIENNNKINRNLEEQAQVIFDNWFVDLEPFGGDVPSTWKIRNLGSVCNCELGGTPSRKKEEYWNGDIPWINSGAVNLFRITKPSERITELGLNKSATKLLPVKTTVLAITGATLGQVSLLEIASCANQSVVGVIPNDILPYEFVYPYIKANIEELISHQTGGAQQHINKQNVESLNVTVPDKDTIIKYVEKVTGIYSMIANSCFEIEKLTELRDALMPKLISGELDVSDLEL